MAVTKDESIIGTNDYSIVSKRSVERLYYANEPDFLRPFVPKFKRRAPLINRGYWLRMRAVEHEVARFLQQGTETPQAIVNLGCGYDPLPFRTMWQHRAASAKVKFVDLDYPQLIERKTTMLRGAEAANIMYGADYVGRGCDLRDLHAVESLLNQELGLQDHSILFVAEVSITYMDVDSTDALLGFLSRYNQARFCLLEQFLPDGASHPFASTMLKHFAQGRTPLGSIHRYPGLQHQRLRFINAGWKTVEARSLWDLWQDPTFLSSDLRLGLDAVEPFDEWEEFALYAGHYVLVIADTAGEVSIPKSNPTGVAHAAPSQSSESVALQQIKLSQSYGQHCFSAMFNVDGQTKALHGGLTSPRQSGRWHGITSSHDNSVPHNLPPHVSCHTITKLEDHSALLVGGRSSPTDASSQCWKLQNGAWIAVHTLLPGRFRHCSSSVVADMRAAVLCFGGRTANGDVIGDWALWLPEAGWTTLDVHGSHPVARFGASMISLSDSHGLIMGGMTRDGVILRDCWEWHLRKTITFEVVLTERSSWISSTPYASRFGAQLVTSPWGIMLVGGVSSEGVIPASEEIMVADPSMSFAGLMNPLHSQAIRPLLIGTSVEGLASGQVLIAGGGAVCFSFGSYTNEEAYILWAEHSTTQLPWRSITGLLQNAEDRKAAADLTENPSLARRAEELQETQLVEPELLKRIEIGHSFNFSEIVATQVPVVFGGLGFGDCTARWHSSYILQKLGTSRGVVVHSATTRNLSFVQKNFAYENTTLSQFLAAADAGEHVYLRSVSQNKPNKTATSLELDFAEVAGDFEIPMQMKDLMSKDTVHSSVLRISGDINMWLHYDVMANILCQVRGVKQVVLFPPSAATALRFGAGETTSAFNVFVDGNRSLLRAPKGTKPFTVNLDEGDVLFIPPCWPHATASSSGNSQAQMLRSESRSNIAVNVFFRSLDSGSYAAGRDVYGNRDLAAYENGRAFLTKLVAHLETTKDVESRIKISTEIAKLLLTGARSIRLDPKAHKLVQRIKTPLSALPKQLEEFYASRLAAELLEIHIAQKPPKPDAEC